MCVSPTVHRSARWVLLLLLPLLLLLLLLLRLLLVLLLLLFILLLLSLQLLIIGIIIGLQQTDSRLRTTRAYLSSMYVFEARRHANVYMTVKKTIHCFNSLS